MQKAATLKNLRKGFFHIPILISTIVILTIVASATLAGFNRKSQERNFDLLCKNFPNLSRCETQPNSSKSTLLTKPETKITPSPYNLSTNRPTLNTNPNLTSSPTLYATPKEELKKEPVFYKQPQGKYTLTIPGEWTINQTTATETYSTTKFTGPNGYVSITFGSGKDPIGGCSEASAVELADRTISGCFLLQKDGTQILTRAYTKDNAGINFTIEAYMNSPLSYHRPVVLGVVGTIDIE